MARMVSCRFASLESGNANRKLNSAVFLNFGDRVSSRPATAAPVARASERGNNPTTLSTLHATAYASHSFIGKTSYLRACKYKAGNPMLEFGSISSLPANPFQPRRECSVRREQP
jgi:hypothetical protein